MLILVILCRIMLAVAVVIQEDSGQPESFSGPKKETTTVENKAEITHGKTIAKALVTSIWNFIVSPEFTKILATELNYNTDFLKDMGFTFVEEGIALMPGNNPLQIYGVICSVQNNLENNLNKFPVIHVLAKVKATEGDTVKLQGPPTVAVKSAIQTSLDLVYYMYNEGMIIHSWSKWKDWAIATAETDNVNEINSTLLQSLPLRFLHQDKSAGNKNP